MRVLPVVVAAALAGTAACSAPPPIQTITLQDMAFGPAPAQLRVGQTIQWVNNDIFQHSATARDGSFDVVLPSKGNGRTVLRSPGRIEVYCRYHPGMTLVLNVTK